MLATLHSTKPHQLGGIQRPAGENHLVPILNEPLLTTLKDEVIFASIPSGFSYCTTRRTNIDDKLLWRIYAWHLQEMSFAIADQN